MKTSTNANISLVLATTAILLFGVAPVQGAVTIWLPVDLVSTGVNDFSEPVVVSNIDAADNVMGWSGDFTFDSSVVTFQEPEVSPGALIPSNWTVYAAVVGSGQIRTLRLEGFSIDWVTPLSGSGVLFYLNFTRVSNMPGAVSPLTWQPPPNNFYFFDGDLNPVATDPVSGSITIGTCPPTPTPTPTPPPGLVISGNLPYCANPSPNPVGGVTLTLTGTSGGTTLSNSLGNYAFVGLANGSYTVTPTKADRVPGSDGITSIDAMAVRQHYLGITLLTGCALTAADVNGDNNVTGVDAIAINRFYLGYTTGIGNVGKYRFNPANRTYSSISTNQTGQGYDTLVLGDVHDRFMEAPPLGCSGSDNAIAPTVATVSLPNAQIDVSTSSAAAVTTSTIDPANRLVGFQGDFAFDERVVSFEGEPVRQAGLTAGNWEVLGRVLDGPGPIRILRIVGGSNDLKPLSGSGTLFELRMNRVNKGPGSTQLVWAAPPSNFIFIDADLKTQKPGYAASGSIAPSTRGK